MKPSEKQTAHRHSKTNTGRDSLLRLRAEDEPTTSSLSSVTSPLNRSVKSVRGVPGRSPGLWVVASRHERRGFVSDSERFPRTAQRPGVAMPQRSKPLAPPSWGGANTYKTAYINNAGVRGRTPAGTGAGTPRFGISKFPILGSVCFLVPTVPQLLTTLRTALAVRAFSPSFRRRFLACSPTSYVTLNKVIQEQCHAARSQGLVAGIQAERFTGSTATLATSGEVVRLYGDYAHRDLRVSVDVLTVIGGAS